MFNIVRTIPPTALVPSNPLSFVPERLRLLKAFRVVVPSRARSGTTRAWDMGWQGPGLTSRCWRKNWSESDTQKLFLIASRLRIDLCLTEWGSAAACERSAWKYRGVLRENRRLHGLRKVAEPVDRCRTKSGRS